mgnify:CR=1 FL=1
MGCKSAYEVDIVSVNSLAYFKGSDVTKILKYSNGRQAIQHNVPSKYVKTWEELAQGESGGPVYTVDTLTQEGVYTVDALIKGNKEPCGSTLYIAEPGVYSLILRSKKEEAEGFQDYIFEVVLPEIRAQGSYQSRKP